MSTSPRRRVMLCLQVAGFAECVESTLLLLTALCSGGCVFGLQGRRQALPLAAARRPGVRRHCAGRLHTEHRCALLWCRSSLPVCKLTQAFVARAPCPLLACQNMGFVQTPPPLFFCPRLSAQR